MNAGTVLQQLQAWRDQGWLRALDLALAKFLHTLDATTPPSLLLAAAWLAQLEGRGHSCLPLAAGPQELPAWLAWPPEAQPGLAEAWVQLPADAASARRAWAGSTVLEIDPAGTTGSTPLVLHGNRLYLRRYWRHESEIAAQVLQRARPQALPGPADQARARALLAQLFGNTAGPDAAATGPDWQQVACALALRARLCLVTGGPGTGKTYTAARLLVLQQALHRGPQPLRVALAAPTGKAAARLRQAMVAALQGLQAPPADGVPGRPLPAWAESLGPARTLHALLGTRPGTRRFVHDAAQPLAIDLLFVDEASMVHLEMMAALLQALPPGARLVLLGDRDQLASVEAGAVMGELCAGAGAEAPGYAPATVHWVQVLSGQALPADPAAREDGLAQQTVVLRQSRRFAGPIGQLALAVNRGDGAAALAALQAPGGEALALVAPREAAAVARLAVQGRGGHAAGYAAALQGLQQRPAAAAAFEPWATALLRQFDRCRVLCAVREGPWGVAGLNAGIEAALVQQGLLARRGEWYEGRPVMVTRNEPTLGIFNGDIGLVLAPPGGGPLRAWFLEGQTLRSVATSRLADVETAFAMTVHKSQGSEFAHVLLVLPEDDNPVLTRELVYTGITRAKEAFTLVAPEPARLLAACARLTRRLSGLAAMLDAARASAG
jgi:exodeoxyribonuclease V alpha subunit